jgi:hypothetical protein
MRTSVAQAFAENGDAFVLRGSPFEWEGKGGRRHRIASLSLAAGSHDRPGSGRRLRRRDLLRARVPPRPGPER